MPLCCSCNLDHPRQAFSKNQLRKQEKRCTFCMNIANRAIEENRAALSENDASYSHRHQTRRREFTNTGFDFTSSNVHPDAIYQVAALAEQQLSKKKKCGRNDDDDDDDQRQEEEEEEEESSNVIIDDSGEEDNNEASLNQNDDDDDHEIFEQDHECGVCLETFVWEDQQDEKSPTSSASANKKKVLHPQTPKYLPCGHLCCFTCVSKIVSSIREQNQQIIMRNNNRLRAGATISSPTMRFQPSSPTSPIAPNTTTSNTATSTAMIGPNPFPTSSSTSSSSVTHQQTRSFSNSFEVLGGGSDNNSNLEEELSPRCPICRQEFLVAMNVPRRIRQRLTRHFSHPRNLERILHHQDSNDENHNTIIGPVPHRHSEQKNMKQSRNKQQEQEQHDHSRLLHMASIGDNMLGTIINLNPKTKIGCILLVETGKSVLFSYKSDNNKNEECLRIGAFVVCDVLDETMNDKSASNLPAITKGDLFAVHVRIFDGTEQDFYRHSHEQNHNAHLSTSSSVDLVNYYDRSSLQDQVRDEHQPQEDQFSRMLSYHYDSSGRRVYSADDVDVDEDEEYYDDDDEQYEDYCEHYTDDHIEDLADRLETRYHGF